MFFSTYVLTKKGPLAKIWLAAHWDKKLTAKDIRVIDLNDTVVQIVQPSVPIALRTSGELMLGVVRIYAAKVLQLLKDASEVTLILRPRNVQFVKGAPNANGKDTGAGVTMDLVVGRVGADQLVEADFEDIADILGPSGNKPAKRGPMAEAEVVGAAWFPVDNSQLDDILATDADIAKVRQDLLAAFGQNRDASSTTSGKKSSLSSVEATRAQIAGIGVDDIEIGAPAPDDMDFAVPAPLDAGDLLMMDPFALPAMDADVPPAAGETTTAAKPLKKGKAVTLVDANDTILSREQLQRNVDSRQDIVCAERRHGPVDAAEARDRATLRAAADGLSTLTACGTTIYCPNPALAAVYQQALRRSAEDTLAALERTRAPQGDDHGRKTAVPAPPAFHDDLANAPQFDLPQPPEFDYAPDALPDAPAPEDGGRRSGNNKRGIDGERLSTYTTATLARLKQMLGGRGVTSIKFSALVKGEGRISTARTFVDVLSLASLNFVSVTQAAPYADIIISAGAKMATA